MKILMVLEGAFPPDSRVEKEMISLSEHGGEISLACITHEKTKPLIEKTAYYTIYRKYINKKIFDKLRAMPLVLPYYFYWWRSFIKELYQHSKFDAVHVHDLPLSKVGYYFKKKYGVKLICDQHEFYSDWIKNTAHMKTFPGRIILSLGSWAKYEQKYLNLADFVITVAKPLQDNYIRKYKIQEDKIITIPNTPTKLIYNQNNIKESIIGEYKEHFILFYAGGIDILRGIDTAIIALKEIKKTIPNVKLILCGKTAKTYDPLKTAQENDVLENVEFKGWIKEEDLPGYIAASNICFFTPPANRDEINKTIATKIYQYAIMGKPIITSDAKMMKEFVEQNGLGISIESGNSRAFANAVIQIYNGKFLVSQSKKPDEWYWEETVKPLISLYSELRDTIS